MILAVELFADLKIKRNKEVPMHRKETKLLWNDLHLISDLNIRLIILEIGTNDLSRTSACPEEISRDIFLFIDDCFKKGASYVVVCEILYRKIHHNFNKKI